MSCGRRVQQAVHRASGRAVGLADCIRFQSQIDGGRGGDDGFAAGRFEETAENPFFEHVDIFVVELGTIRRHVRFFSVRDCFPEFGTIKVAGDEDNAGAAAFERALVAGEVEVSLFLVSIVTFGAISFDERENVVCVGDFVLGKESAYGRDECDGSEQRDA